MDKRSSQNSDKFAHKNLEKHIEQLEKECKHTMIAAAVILLMAILSTFIFFKSLILN